MPKADKNPQKLFVYGTLQPGRAPSEIRGTVSRLRQIGHGSVRGRVLQFAEYPGLVLDDNGERISGVVLEVPDRKTLSALDNYEEYQPQNRNASLFVRERTPVQLTSGEVMNCWVYVYNRPAA